MLTIFPNILASFMQGYAETPLEATIDEPVPMRLDRLLRVPYFVQAYQEDGVTPADYGSLPGLVATGASFSQAMQSFDAIAHEVRGSNDSV